MKPFPPLIPILLLAATLAGCARQSRVSPPDAAIVQGAWHVPDEAYFRRILPAPPAPGSPAERRDVGAVLALQAHITPARVAEAKRTLNLSVFTFADAMGFDFTPERYPLTAAFFRRLNDVVRTVNDGLKDHYHRPHPFEADPRIRRLVIAPARYSYPSYHSARCVVFGRTLELLDAQAARDVRGIARQVERDRVFAGEHFPTDIAAGRIEGEAIFRALERDPAFRADIARLKRAEWTPSPRLRTVRGTMDALKHP